MTKKQDIWLEDVQEGRVVLSPIKEALAAAPITAWSFSRYQTYSQCPYKFALQNIYKVQTPGSPALRRGRVVHDEAANYLLGKVDVVPESMKSRVDFLDQLKTMNPFIEQKWGYDAKWRVTGYFDKRKGKETWLRGSLDAGVDYGDGTFEAIDWKTGKKHDDNAEQMELFGILVLVRFPTVQKVMTRLSYVDMPAGPNSETYDEVKGKDKKTLIDKWSKKAAPMFNDTIFAPRQNDKCHFCNFNRSKGGPCRYG